MGLKNLFHKIKTGFARLSGKSIPNISSTKDTEIAERSLL